MNSENTTTPLLAGDEISTADYLEAVARSDEAKILNKEKFTALDRIGKYDLSEIRKLDLVLYFLIGMFNDLDVGYTGTATFSTFIALPNFNAAPTAFATMIGGVVGALLTTFVLMGFRPEVRIVTLAAIQFTGGLFAWVLPSPYNNVLGMGIMFCGVIGTQTAMTPLTYYSSAYSTTMYLAGLQVSVLFGSTLINIFDALNFGKAAFMLVLLCFPIVTCILFFNLDRSVFVNDGIDVKGHGGDIEGENIKGTSGIENENVNTSTTASIMKSMGPYATSESAVSERLPKADMLAAFTEIRFRYIPTFALTAFFDMLYLSSINIPFESSSLSYGGHTIDTIFKAGDHVSLATGLLMAVVGLSILTPLGKIVSNMTPRALLMPTIVMIILVVLVLSGMLYNDFPPMPIWAFYVVALAISFVPGFFGAYAPLFVGADKMLTRKYNEFQTQLSLSVYNIFLLIASIFSMLWFSPHVHSECEANYEANYEGVTCDLFSN
mmetsp:Transcript_31957/g.77255  ORF Transcript_31957/g.77255 Transcript_31957/m.77255 type:complete len:493 (+) Transcript_31957:186-1664(+)